MNSFDFPEMPTYSGYWQPIYFEPVLGSGERITIAVVAIGNTGEFQVIQAIRTELLECLYGNRASHIHSMINLVIASSHKCISKYKNLLEWQAPFSGLILGEGVQALDKDLNGIVRQAIQFSSSLSSLAIDAERDDDEQVQPRKYASQFATNIQKELKIINPSLNDCFNQKIKVSGSDVMTSYGFMNELYASNFGLLLPTRMSTSLNSVKAKIFDIEALKKSNYLMMPEHFEMIIGTPSLDDPTLSEKAVIRLKNTLEMVEELALKEDIKVFRVNTAIDAANHINSVAA